MCVPTKMNDVCAPINGEILRLHRKERCFFIFSPPARSAPGGEAEQSPAAPRRHTRHIEAVHRDNGAHLPPFLGTEGLSITREEEGRGGERRGEEGRGGQGPAGR